MTVLQQLSSDVADLVAGVRQSLVQIHNGSRGAGAGSIWHQDGLIVTNAHVVGSRNLTVALPDGREMPGRVIAHDKDLDLAAVAVDATGLPNIEVGDSRSLRPGHVVLAMGHPWGVAGAVTAGVVIGMGASHEGHGSADREWLITNLSLRPGNSGGPMLDAEGRLVGVSTMITGPEIAMAVPVHVAKTFLQDALHSEQTRV